MHKLPTMSNMKLQMSWNSLALLLWENFVISQLLYFQPKLICEKNDCDLGFLYSSFIKNLYGSTNSIFCLYVSSHWETWRKLTEIRKNFLSYYYYCPDTRSPKSAKSKFTSPPRWKCTQFQFNLWWCWARWSRTGCGAIAIPFCRTWLNRTFLLCIANEIFQMQNLSFIGCSRMAILDDNVQKYSEQSCKTGE